MNNILIKRKERRKPATYFSFNFGKKENSCCLSLPFSTLALFIVVNHGSIVCSKASKKYSTNYLQRLQIIMEALQIDGKDKVGFLLASLQGKALAKLNQSPLVINAHTTWNNATTMLIKLFDPMQSPGNIQILRQLKQLKNQNFIDFTNMVNQMVNKIFVQQLGYSNAQRESETIRYSIRGAKKEIKSHLKGTKYNTIKAMTTKAQVLETKLGN